MREATRHFVVNFIQEIDEICVCDKPDKHMCHLGLQIERNPLKSFKQFQLLPLYEEVTCVTIEETVKFINFQILLIRTFQWENSKQRRKNFSLSKNLCKCNNEKSCNYRNSIRPLLCFLGKTTSKHVYFFVVVVNFCSVIRDDARKSLS